MPTIAGWVIEAPLGEGGMAQVYRARRATGGDPVALKVLESGAIERFAREAAALARLAHPNVVRTLGTGVENGRAWLALELVEGESLAQLVARGRFPPAAVERIARELAAGLGAAHAAGLIHRDLKPANVMRAKDGRTVLIDFGIALDEDLTRLTATGHVAGSLPYLSPEQARGEPLDARSDIYQLGLVLLELLTGARPHPGAPTPAGTPAGLALAVRRCVEEDRERRPASMQEVLALLDGRSADPDAPRTLGGYTLVEKLGQGGMGVVWRARKPGSPVDYALKLVLPHLAASADAAQRFRREIRLARRVDHPALVRLVDDGEAGGELYLVMEFVRGRTLADRIREDGPLAPDAALALVARLAEALDALHQRGVVHRDLKPANVMVDARNQVKLMDLGAARAHDLTTLTRTAELLGTPLYMPPEYTELAVYDERSDLYQLGLVLHEAVTGRRTFPKSDGARPTSPTQVPVPPALAGHATGARLYQALLNPSPGHRPGSAQEVLALLAKRGGRGGGVIRSGFWLARGLVVALIVITAVVVASQVPAILRRLAHH